MSRPIRQAHGKQGFAPIVIIVIVAIALALGGGVLYYAKKNSAPRTQPTSAITTTTTTTTTTTITTTTTADWKTYRNEKYGFEVKYPVSWTVQNDWKIVSGGETLYLGPPNEELLSEGATFYVEPSTVNEYLKKFTGIANTSQRNIGDISWTIVHFFNPNRLEGSKYSIGAITKKGGHIFYLVISSDKDYNNITFNQILSTFKFTGQVGTKPKNDNGVVCTQDAKLCPDGSYVSRTGPSCEFKTCPVASNPGIPAGLALSGTEGWNKYRNTKYAFQFYYPADHTAYGKISASSKSLVAAGSSDDEVNVAEDENKLFTDQSQAIVLKITIANVDMQIDDWVDQNISKYVSDITSVSRKKTTVSGKTAIEITQPASGANSVHKLVVIQPGNYFIVVTESAPSTFLDQVFATFNFGR